MGKTRDTGFLTNGLWQDASNNIGIGGSPSGSFKFEVTGISRFWDGTQGLLVRAYTGGSGFGAIYSTGVTPGAGNFALAASSTATILSGVDNVSMAINSATKLYINNAGNVGIGTSNPSGQLDIYATGTDLATYFTQASAGNNNFTRWTRASGPTLIAGVVRNSNDGNQKANTAFMGTTNAYDYLFYTNDLERMRITSSGNVGIGTSSPAAFGTVNLDVNAGAGGAAYIVARANSNGGTTELAFDGSAGYLSTKSNHPLIIRTNDTERMRVQADGRINSTMATNTTNTHYIIHSGTNPFGINITYSGASPNGTGNNFIYLTDSTTARFVAQSNGGLANYQANNANLSDERTKKDIIPLESYWDKFKAIEIVKFKYIDQTHDDFNIGVIAQQVEKIAPEFIDVDGFGETPEDGIPYKTVYTSDLHHATIKVLQETMAKIEELETKVSALENK
jgi:hypothetical protein